MHHNIPDLLLTYIACTKATEMWFHAAHHVTKGTGFGGDHINIYGRIYTELEEDFDEIVEKGLGLTGDETLADPVSILSMAAGQLSQYPPPSNQDAEYIASNALEVAKAYIAFIEQIYKQFESCGMSLGLDDQLQGFANKYETYVYLLQQRTRTSAMNVSPIVGITETRLRRTLRRVLNESAGFSVYSERGKYIESSDGSLLQLSDISEPKIIVSNRQERGSLVLQRGRIYFSTNRRDQFFSNLQELCDFLNQNNFEYEGIDDY